MKRKKKELVVTNNFDFYRTNPQQLRLKIDKNLNFIIQNPLQIDKH